MVTKSHFPLLYQVLENWADVPERPPLLIVGFSKIEWNWLENEFLKIMFKLTKPINTKINPDILILEKETAKNTIEVEQTRQFIHALSTTCQNFPIKVGIIPQAQHLTHQSQNALLKTLEEPHARRYLVLLAPLKNSLLPTITSRSFVFNVSSQSALVIGKYLEEKFPSLSDAKRDKIIQWSGLNFGLAVKIAGNYNYWRGIKTFAARQKKLSAAKTLKASNEWQGNPDVQIIDFFYFEKARLVRKLKKFLQKEPGSRINLQNIIKKLNLILDYLDQAQSLSGANPKLMLEAYLLKK